MSNERTEIESVKPSVEQTDSSSKRNRDQQNHPLDKVIGKDLLKVEVNQKADFLRNTFTNQLNTHQNNAIRFADTKAGALSGANALILTYVIDQISHSTGYIKISLILGLICLIISISYSLRVIYPRLMNSKEKGIVYWENVINYTKEDYTKIIAEGKTSQFLESLVENNYTQAIILTKKFKRLETGFNFCIGGYVLIGVGLIINFFV